MALNFKGETTTAVLNNTENVYKKDDLFRLYDAGVLKLGNVVCEHGDFVSWTGTAWKLEKDAGYAVETSGAGESLEERVDAIEDVIPDDASADNKLATNKETAYLKQLLTNPLNLPDKTIRCKFKSGYTPTMGTSQTLVDADNNVWDIGFENAVALFESSSLVEVIGANTSGVTDMTSMFVYCEDLEKVALFDTSSVTNMSGMFLYCPILTSVPLFDTSSVTNMGPNENYGFIGMFGGCQSLKSVPRFDTSSVTNMSGMFASCKSLTSVPLFDTSSVTNMSGMFRDCEEVTGGALALYQQASAKNPQPSHTYAFQNCGINTITGATELAQIPASWGGTGAG